MRIVIDLQGAQSLSRNRGVGRYSLSITKALIRNRGENEVILALNGLFADSIEPIRADFAGILPQENICVWQAPGPLHYLDSANNWRRKAAERIREIFLMSLNPDILFVSHIFEGLVDDVATSIGILEKTNPTAAIFYDLIPLIHRQFYLNDSVVEAWYENKLDHLRRADLLLAISESSRQEAINYLGFPAGQVINASAAADAQFRRCDISAATEGLVRDRYSLKQQIVMYTGGIDYRKNIEGLIRAYALLPKSLRKNHQLAIVCSANPDGRRLLEALARQQDLAENEVILTGFVPDEDLVALYHLCKVFVYPSCHEGFGLPVLEAMSCGAAVIGANTSSVPEVIGREDALFDPFDDRAIAEKLAQVLTDSDYRAALSHHCLEQAKKFSWDESAKRVLTGFEQLQNAREGAPQTLSFPRHRPKMAYVSPLPPERSGISYYSADLLLQLSRYYDIDVIVAQQTVTDPWVLANCPIRDAEWFADHGHLYERVLYNMGNSVFHQHMFDLLPRVPGVVVLHDFFLGHIMAHMEGQGGNNIWSHALYQSHGYGAIRDRFHADNIWDVAWKYPCNKSVLENAQGVIVLSNYPRGLGREWLGETFVKDWAVISPLRTSPITEGRAKARRVLGLDEDAFLVCSFGILIPNKENQRLLDAWLASSLRKDQRCLLVFVGENPDSDYGQAVAGAIRDSEHCDRIRITGWVDATQYQQYLTAADIAVQLRTNSRGGPSAAVLDSMNYGLPTIVNAHGSEAELPDDAVWMLPDEFDEADLSQALETLWKDEDRRLAMGRRAREVILTEHAPRTCADQYFQAIEGYYKHTQTLRPKDCLVKALTKIDGAPDEENCWLALAKDISQDFPGANAKQLMIDVSVLRQVDAQTGIQRVVRSILSELLLNPPKDFRVEPIYADPGQAGYRYARQFTLGFLGCPEGVLEDEPVEAYNRDVFLGLDLHQTIVKHKANYYQYLRRLGVQVHFVVYDLLPVLLPEAFPEGVHHLHTEWLTTLAQTDGAICISRTVADQMAEWLITSGVQRLRPFNLGWFHLGADMEQSIPTTGLPPDGSHILGELTRRPTFLMVGTLEPRKAYEQTLSAFEHLWTRGFDVGLVIVGKQGWKVENLIDKMRNHREFNRRLFWLSGISDEYLGKIYAASTCLIAASEGEGFGLPLFEAAQHKLPIIARDIPVFREVAGQHAFFFSGDSNDIANAIQSWLLLHQAGTTPRSEGMSWLTWKESTQNLLKVLLGRNWYKQWMPDGMSHV